MSVFVGSRTAPEHRGPAWLQLAIGVVAVLVGVFIFVQPVLAAIALAQALAFIWLFTGTIEAVEAVVYRRQLWAWRLVGGVLGIVAGVAVLVWPVTATLLGAAALVIYAAVLILMMGIAELISGLARERDWGQIAKGVLQLIVALLLLIYPQSGAVLLMQLAALSAIVFGLVLVALSWLVPRMVSA